MLKPMSNGRPQKERKLVLKTNLSLNEGRKYCRMLTFAIRSTFIEGNILQYFRPSFNTLPFVINIFVLSNFEWPYYTGLLVIGPYTLSQKLNQLMTKPHTDPYIFCRKMTSLKCNLDKEYGLLLCCDTYAIPSQHPVTGHYRPASETFR